MTPWTEADSATFRAIAPVAVPRRHEMIEALVGAAPFAAQDPISKIPQYKVCGCKVRRGE